jgi:D-alanine-D-alanine ligase
MIAIDKQKIKGAIAVLYGGESSEREVSLQSGKAVINAFKALGVDIIEIDVKVADLAAVIQQHQIKHCFIILHGGAGENGQVQALLESLGVTYTGSGVMGCAIAMDKFRTKLLWRGAGIPTADFMLVNAETTWLEVSGLLGEKMMLKPCSEGSSIGMSIVDSKASFEAAVKFALQYDADVIAEKWITGAEYTVAIIGGEALPVIQLKTENRFYDYEAKYISNETKYLCPCGLNDKDEAFVQSISVKAFNLLDCKGWGRIDVMRDVDDKFYLLEANTVPGMTSHSLVPMAAAAKSMSFSDLVAKIFNQSLSE